MVLLGIHKGPSVALANAQAAVVLSARSLAEGFVGFFHPLRTLKTIFTRQSPSAPASRAGDPSVTGAHALETLRVLAHDLERLKSEYKHELSKGGTEASTAPPYARVQALRDLEVSIEQLTTTLKQPHAMPSPRVELLLTTTLTLTYLIMDLLGPGLLDAHKKTTAETHH